MTKITLDLEQLKAERAIHEDAIKRIDCILQYYFEKNQHTKRHIDYSLDNNSVQPRTSRMQQALKICEEHLGCGNIVHSVNEFRKIVENQGIKLSRAGIALSLKKSESNIYFDSEKRIWKLKIQE